MMQRAWDRIGRAKDAPFDDPTAIQRQGTPEEVANVVGFLLGPESSFVSVILQSGLLELPAGASYWNFPL